MNTSDLYKKDGGAAYHSNKHFESEKSVALISTFRAKKFQPYIKPGDKVLEYGVGAGWNLCRIECAEKLGYDVSTWVKPLLDKYGIDFTNNTHEIPKGYFDIVICHHVLEHVPNPLETLKELKVYMKPQGKLLLFVPTDTSLRFNKYDPANKDHHLFCWNVQALCTLAQESGFQVIEYSRRLYGFDRFVSNWIGNSKLPGFLFYPIFYLLNFIRPDREIKLICNQQIQVDLDISPDDKR